MSNHPPSIICELSGSIDQRIYKLWSNENTFDATAPIYNEALEQSNFNTQRNVIWFNTSYSKNIKTNIARNFLQLIDKHFPPNNKLYKLFNRYTICISYSCNENMKSFINRHDNRTKSTNTNDTCHCNCRQPDQCPIQGNSLKTNINLQGQSYNNWQRGDTNINGRHSQQLQK